MEFVTKDLSPELWPAFEAYFNFKGRSSGCWCMNHRLPMGLNFEGEAARLAMKQLVESGRVFGVLAFAKDDPIPVGWCSLDRKKTLPGHDCIGEEINCGSDVWSIHCVTARADLKNHGIEEVLCSEAVKLAERLKAQTVESYPEPGSEPGKNFQTWNTFNGFESYFLKLGFEVIPNDLDERKQFYRPMQKSLR